MSQTTSNFNLNADEFTKWSLDGQKSAELLTEKIKAEKGNLSILAALNLHNELEMKLADVFNRAGLLQSVHPDEALRTAAEKAEQQIVALMTKLSLDKELYESFAVLQDSADTLDDKAKRNYKKIIRDFKRSGVDKDEATREKVKKLNDELTEVTQSFGRNIREDTRYVEIKDSKRLAGLPEDFLASHKPDENGVTKISTDWADYFPTITYADDDKLREDIWRTKMNLGYPKNVDTLKKLLAVRHELASTLGYKSWADYATEELMIKTPKNAGDFISKVASLARSRGERDVNTLLERLKEDQSDAKEVMPWQGPYMIRKVKMEQRQFNPKEVRPFFEVSKVLQGIMDISSKLFSIEFKKVEDAKTWFESVICYDIMEGSKKLGRIYLDLYPRENKYKHAAMFPIVGGISGVRFAEGGIVCNFPDPSKTEGEALLEHNDVTTFFHEFGHLLHHVLGGDQEWHRFSGVETEWDFVEVPSQLFEEWAWDYDMLQSFATNNKDEAIGKELVEKMKNANEFGKGQQVMQQMAYASISLGLYSQDPKGIDIDSFLSEMLSKYSVFAYVPETHFECGFGHLTEYSSNYYTYMWSLVISKDLYGAFKAKGLSDTSTSENYRKTILGAGGSKDAAELVKDFLGREFGFEAFETWLREGE